MNRLLSHVVAAIAITAALSIPALAQTAGGTVISNQASATYSDGTNNFSTVSNTVTVTVSNVSGLAITPDAQANPTVVGGQTGVLYTFTVTNTGNFSDQVRFLAGGASITVSGPGTITRAVIDVDNSNTINAGDTDIKTNGADVLSASIAQNGSIKVLVEVSVSAAATSGQVVQVILGDAATGGPTFDNQAANSSANEVRTVSAASVNGLREAHGDISSTVDNDAQLQVTLTAPPGPVALGSNITYTMQTCNTGARPVTSITLGSFSGVYIIAPIPAGTALTTGQSFPAGTLYTTSPLSTAPTAATWSSSAPVPLSNTTRVAFDVGSSLAVGACSANITMQVTITTSDATTPIYEIVDTFGTNSVAATITDQSGDAIPGKGDGNANFDEPRQGQPASATQGFQQPTTLEQVGAVQLGPQNHPDAVGPTSSNDDYTNRSVTTGIAGVAPGGVTTASGQVTFTNTIKNTGNAADIYQLSAPTIPAGFTVELSVDGGIFTPLIGPGAYVSVPVAFGATKDILVRITAPAGITVLTGYATVLRATSTIPLTVSSNDTIDRLYTGFIRLDKTVTVNNSTGVGAATDPVPGAQLSYAITYTNVSSSGGTNSSTLTATSIVITEDGNALPNNWGTTTDHVVGATDTLGGTITGDAAGSTLLTDSVASLAPGQSGVFTFKRVIK